MAGPVGIILALTRTVAAKRAQLLREFPNGRGGVIKTPGSHALMDEINRMQKAIDSGTGVVEPRGGGTGSRTPAGGIASLEQRPRAATYEQGARESKRPAYDHTGSQRVDLGTSTSPELTGLMQRYGNYGSRLPAVAPVGMGAGQMMSQPQPQQPVR